MYDSVMNIPRNSSLVGQTGVYDLLEEILTRQEIAESDLPYVAGRLGVASVEKLMEDLVERLILQKSGSFFYLTERGRRIWHLMRGINGGNIADVIHHLVLLDPGLRPYEIVREGMTAEFVNGLLKQPDFKRVLICSPWLHIREKLLRKFYRAVYIAQAKTKVEIVVASRPLDKGASGYSAFLRTFQALEKMGADIVTHDDLHAKLYIRDQGPAGGLRVALFGSENLTGNRNIELGIRITNDNTIINKLISHFFDIYNICTPYQEEPT